MTMTGLGFVRDVSPHKFGLFTSGEWLVATRIRKKPYAAPTFESTLQGVEAV